MVGSVSKHDGYPGDFLGLLLDPYKNNTGIIIRSKCYHISIVKAPHQGLDKITEGQNLSYSGIECKDHFGK